MDSEEGGKGGVYPAATDTAAKQGDPVLSSSMGSVNLYRTLKHTGREAGIVAVLDTD